MQIPHSDDLNPINLEVVELDHAEGVDRLISNGKGQTDVDGGTREGAVQG